MKKLIYLTLLIITSSCLTQEINDRPRKYNISLVEKIRTDLAGLKVL